MKTIETDPELSAAFDHFKPHSNAVFATGRILNGQWLQDNCQEWAEYGTSECQSEYVCDYPFDKSHAEKINIAERDINGDFDQI